MAGFNFGTPASTAPTFALGSNTTTGGTSGFNFGATTTSNSSTTPGLQFNTPTSTPGAVTFGAPAATSSSGFTFGSTGGLSMGTPAANQTTLFATSAGIQPNLSFGSTPATTTQGLTFGNTQGPTQTGLTFGTTPSTTQATPSFGSTPATVQPLSFGNVTTTPQLPFGGTPATSQTLSFGSTPATTQTLSFGSTPATTQTLSFGSTPATTQTLSFGSTPAASQPLNFGSTPTNTQTLSFGSTPATTPSLSFGNTQTTTQPLTFGSTTQPSLSFGSTPITTQTPLNFGLSTPATSASAGFPLGTPATTAATKNLSFGLGGQTAVTKPALSFGTATTTSTPLLNFSAPKTTTTTGFSLSVSTGTGTGSLFALPTTSAPTTSAPTPFKGLGGVDTTTTQGSGQKDTKSAKENLVNPEIMQTLDTFKNFVKQQKNLSCEVSRAPVKPMHKVTEDSDALNKLLASVSSALQKNRVIANKLKSDTTKCLSLCEMAQRTHDTPPGLQNDNVAPLEFFIQLVSKFERDIQVLRQEIDNTEKHVNSLSYPAILTPQELSIALRRLYDSFVALAGRLQTAHAGVIAQKERHLSLRRHFLKDPTNIFETPSRSAKKPLCPVGLPKPGPTPFSSMGGIHNITMMSGQEKHVTFSTGPTSLSGWGVSAMSSTPSSSLLQSPGQSQTLDNQNFQLGKPPAGNKRGKR